MYGDQFAEFVSGYWINSELESFLNALLIHKMLL